MLPVASRLLAHVELSLPVPVPLLLVLIEWRRKGKGDGGESAKGVAPALLWISMLSLPQLWVSACWVRAPRVCGVAVAVLQGDRVELAAVALEL